MASDPFTRFRHGQLRFDRRLVDNGPHQLNLVVAEKDVLLERNCATINWQPEQFTLGCTVEAQTACDRGRIRDQDIDLEVEVRYLFEVLLQHGPVTVEADLL